MIREAPPAMTNDRSLARLRSILGASIFLGLGFGAAMCSGPAQAQSPEIFEPRNVAALPPYCIHTQGYRAKLGAPKDADTEHWYQVLGGEFNHLHHYCGFLVFLNKAKIRPTFEAKRDLNNVIGDANYVIERVPADYVLLPEFLSKRGEAYLIVGNTSRAVEDLQKAIATKPDYWPPYLLLADFYQRAGDVPKARQLIDQGLASAPDAQPLRKKRDDLSKGGKPASGAPPAASK